MPCQMISATFYINSYAHVRDWLRKGSKRTTAMTTNLQSNENARRAGGRARSLCHRDCRLPTNQPTNRGRTDHRTKLTSRRRRRRRRRQFIDCQFVTTPSTQACPRRGGESPDRLRDRSRESCAKPLSPLVLTGGGRTEDDRFHYSKKITP